MATIGQMNVKLNLDATGALKALEESKSKLADVGRESSRQMKIIGANLGEATAKMSLNASASEVLAVKQQALTSKVEEQRKYVAALSDAYQKSVAALGNNADETGKLELRMAKAKETEAKLEQQLRQTTQEMQKQSTESSNLSSKMESSFKKLKDVGEKMSVGVTAPLVGFTAAATEGTEELRTELSKLDANARRESASIEQVNNLYRDMYAITGELDSNTEAFSNLLKSGFKGDALKQVTEQLAGASLMFKDTLKFEGLGDGLQETLGTLNAVGPFAELLERLGLNLNTFNAGLKEAAANGTQTQYVLDVLAKQGLANNYKEYVKNNQALVENKKSTYDLMVSMSEFAKAATPVFTKLNQVMTYATNKFNSLPGSVQSAAITFGILLAALGPVLFILGQISLILGTGGIGKAITWLAGTLLPMLGTVFTTIIGLIMTPIGALVAAIVAIGTAVYFVIENWEPIKTFFSTLWEGITSGAQVVIDWLKEGWQGFADFFIGLWGAIWEPVKGFLNLMISGLNYLIQGLNKLHVTVPKWSPIAPGETWGINIPEIPKFHSGGTFKAPTVGGEGLALLRDGEKVTTPNSNNSTGGNVMLQVGVLVADDRGLKELERRLKVIRIGEGMRGAV